jgi:hypothetical protein
MTDRPYIVPTDAAWLEFITRVNMLEQRAHELGLHVTAQGINAAKNAAGYERAEQLRRREGKP